MEQSPEAIFDSLYLGLSIEKKLEDFNIMEVQFLAYLSCLLSLYDKNPIAFWDYEFIKNELDSPYSIELHNAITFLNQTGYITETSNEHFRIAEKGLKYLDFAESLTSFEKRKRYLKSAKNSISIIPINIIREAIKKEPVMLSARSAPGKRFLLDDQTPALNSLYSDFANLHLALNEEYNDLLTPAVVWLQSLTTLKSLT